jgi:predicted metal-dependent hydrolase
MSLDTVRIFAIAKLPWIKRQQQKLRQQERETPREYIDRESHYIWGKRYLLKITEADQPPSVELSHGRMVLRLRRGTDTAKRQAILDEWYREQVRCAVPPLIEKWERLIGVEVRLFFVQRMKTKWGSCNHHAGSIRLNTDLARKPIECLEYIVVHEMARGCLGLLGVTVGGDLTETARRTETAPYAPKTYRQLFGTSVIQAR